jgi:hypothetical protein
MDGTVTVWIGIGVVTFVMLDLLFVEIRRAAREAQRLATRVSAYTKLPVIGLVAGAQRDVTRITAAVGAIGTLVARAQLAVTVIKTPALWRKPPVGYLPKG